MRFVLINTLADAADAFASAGHAVERPRSPISFERLFKIQRSTSAYEAGRQWGPRVNIISAGPYASRAASAIGFIDQMIDYSSRNTPLPGPITAEQVGVTAAFLSSPLASGITGATVYVDKGFHAMGVAVDREGAR